jgi:hypothetical protein
VEILKGYIPGIYRDDAVGPRRKCCLEWRRWLRRDPNHLLNTYPVDKGSLLLEVVGALATRSVEHIYTQDISGSGVDSDPEGAGRIVCSVD